MSISVVIPAYNAALFIGETLNSVLRQTLQPDEVLVIDDGSTDHTAAIAESYGAPIRVIRRPNSRAAASRNFGVQQATGEWIAFIDADDVWEPNKLERQMQELARHPEADLCYTARILLIQEGKTARLGDVIHVPPAKKIRDALFRNTTFLPSAVVVRRSTFQAVGGHDPSFKIVEDWELWLRLLHAGTKFVDCQEPLVRYRIHPASVSHNAMGTLFEAKRVFRLRVLPHLPPATRWMQHQRSQSGQEAAAACTLRLKGDPGYISLMLRSILRYPFNDFYRYKVLAYMFYIKLTPPAKPVPQKQEKLRA